MTTWLLINNSTGNSRNYSGKRHVRSKQQRRWQTTGGRITLEQRCTWSANTFATKQPDEHLTNEHPFQQVGSSASKRRPRERRRLQITRIRQTWLSHPDRRRLRTTASAAPTTQDKSTAHVQLMSCRVYCKLFTRRSLSSFRKLWLFSLRRLTANLKTWKKILVYLRWNR